jgi:DNA-binding transcriptional LysR family regulator
LSDIEHSLYSREIVIRMGASRRSSLQKMQQSLLSDLNEIVAFVALADTGSFAAAGRQLERDPTIVSRRLNAMEARLGIRLTERSTRKVVLTEAGMAYLARVRPLLGDLQAAGSEAAAFADGEPRGHLRISLPGNFARIWLAPLIVEFLSEHPHVSIEARFDLRFVDLIGERIDLAIRLGELADSRLVARKVAQRRKVVCASPAFLAQHGPIDSPGHLAALPCLFGGSGNRPDRWQFVHADGRRDEVTVTPRLVSNDAELLADAATNGLGVLYGTDWYVSHEIAAGRLVEVLPEWTQAEAGGVYVVTPAASGTPSKTRAFSDWIAARLATPPWRTKA